MLRTQHHSLDRLPLQWFVIHIHCRLIFFLLNRWITAVIAARYWPGMLNINIIVKSILTLAFSSSDFKVTEQCLIQKWI